MKSKRIEGPFTNNYGTFHPGDPCIAITVCTGQVQVTRAQYVGYIERKAYNYRSRQYEPIKFAQIRRPIKISEWYDKTTNEKCNWRPNDSNLGIRYIDSTIVTTLQYNRLLPTQATADDLIKEI